MAHIAGDDIKRNQNCPLHSKLNISEFHDVIEHTEVVTDATDLARESEKNLLNRRAWLFYRRQRKMSTPYEGMLVELDLKNCFTSPE